MEAEFIFQNKGRMHMAPNPEIQFRLGEFPSGNKFLPRTCLRFPAFAILELCNSALQVSLFSYY